MKNIPRAINPTNAYRKDLKRLVRQGKDISKLDDLLIHLSYDVSLDYQAQRSRSGRKLVWASRMPYRK